MAISIVRLGSPRSADEGPRLGTVRRPPRGVPKSEFAKQNFYDVWLPTLSPSAELIKATHVLDDHTHWNTFARRFASELKQPDASHLLETESEQIMAVQPDRTGEDAPGRRGQPV